MQFFSRGNERGLLTSPTINARTCWCVLLSLFFIVEGYGQSTPLKGVVWDAPDPPTVDDLVKIHNTGTEAIRLPLVEDLAIVHAADSLGLQLFQDLPILLLPATALLDTLEYAKQLLNRGRWMYILYPSAHRYGVSAKSDTSHPLSCEYFKELSEWAPELTLYYISAFVADDQCSSYVDLVLVDVRGNPSPLSIINDWNHVTPMGFASFGKRIDPQSFGLNETNSPESQARYLEDHLPNVLNSTLDNVFVYQWQDSVISPYQWGLIDPSDQKRPSYEVLKGIYTNTRHVFTFHLGTQQDESTPWPLILGLITVFLVLFVNLWYKRFPEVMWNYILNKYPHRETIYRESALLGGASFVFAISHGVLLSAVALILIESSQDLGLIEGVVAFLSPEIIQRFHLLISNPALLVLIVTAVYLSLILISSTLGAWGSRQPGSRIPLEHFFVINTMNNTPLGLMLPLVFVSPSLHEHHSVIMAPVLVFSGIVLSVYCSFRSARNFASLARSSLAKGTALGLFILPLMIMVGIALLLWLPSTKEYLVFWWNLTTKS